MGRPEIDSVYTVVVDLTLKARRAAPDIAMFLDNRMPRNDADGVLKIVLMILPAYRFTETLHVGTNSILKPDKI